MGCPVVVGEPAGPDPSDSLPVNPEPGSLAACCPAVFSELPPGFSSSTFRAWGVGPTWLTQCGARPSHLWPGSVGSVTGEFLHIRGVSPLVPPVHWSSLMSRSPGGDPGCLAPWVS